MLWIKPRAAYSQDNFITQMTSFSSSGIQHFVIFAAQPYGLPLKEVTIAQYLKTLGYKTHAVGKVSSLRPRIIAHSWPKRGQEVTMLAIEFKSNWMFLVVVGLIKEKISKQFQQQILSYRYCIHAREKVCDITKTNTPAVWVWSHSISVKLAYTRCTLGQVIAFPYLPWAADIWAKRYRCSPQIG